MDRQNKNTISAAEFDRAFDENKQDILQYFDLSKAWHVNSEALRKNTPDSLVKKTVKVHCQGVQMPC